MFTDYYAEQRCTAGRGIVHHRSGGLRTRDDQGRLAGAALGLRSEDITIAEALKPLGYATGNSARTISATATNSCRRCTGSMSFSATSTTSTPEEEPEHPDYPKDPAFKAKYGPRGVLKCKATDGTIRLSIRASARSEADHRGYRPAYEEAHGDDRRRTSNAAIDFIKRQTRANKPFFCWWNGTRMHLYTHVRPNTKAAAGSANIWTACSSTTATSAACSKRSTISASPTTPSSSTAPTTACT
jgi:arylsulfatase